MGVWTSRKITLFLLQPLQLTSKHPVVPTAPVPSWWGVRIVTCTVVLIRWELLSGFLTYLHEARENLFLIAWDANDLLCLVSTWESGDVSQIRDSGNLEKCLSTIKTYPSRQFFNIFVSLSQPEDNDSEISYMKNSTKLAVIDTVWGKILVLAIAHECDGW